MQRASCLLVRIAQQLAARAEHDRQFLGRDLEPLDQGLGAAVRVGAQQLKGMAVAAQEIGQPQHVRLIGMADDHRADAAALDQADAAQDQGAHDPLAKLGLGDQQGAQPLRRNQHRLDVGQRLGLDQRRPARQLGELAHEGARLVGDDRAGALIVALADLDLARQEQGEAMTGLADPQQHLALRIMARRAEAAQPRELGVGQRREHLRAAGGDDRLGRLGHLGSFRSGARPAYARAADRGRATTATKALDRRAGPGDDAAARSGETSMRSSPPQPSPFSPRRRPPSRAPGARCRSRARPSPPM